MNYIIKGGSEVCTRERKWAKVATRMDHQPSLGATLKNHYERLLFPFDVFKLGKSNAKQVSLWYFLLLKLYVCK